MHGKNMLDTWFIMGIILHLNTICGKQYYMIYFFMYYIDTYNRLLDGLMDNEPNKIHSIKINTNVNSNYN